MKIKSIYDVMAYNGNEVAQYEVAEVKKTSLLTKGDIISYVGCYSFDGDIDKIEIFNHTTQDRIILDYSACSSTVYV